MEKGGFLHMSKQNSSGQKKASITPQPGSTKTPAPQPAVTKTGTASPKTASSPEVTTDVKKPKGGNKSNRPQIGGTAVPGAKSTQPKEMPDTNNPNQQQIASYNRDMRRRMQNLGTGPYSESQKKGKTPQERRQKVIERRKERIEERRAELRKAVPKTRVAIGRKNTYFIIAVAVFLVVLILVFVVLRLVLHLF